MDVLDEEDLVLCDGINIFWWGRILFHSDVDCISIYRIYLRGGSQDGKKSFIRKHYSHIQMKIDIDKPLFCTTICTAEFAFEGGEKVIVQCSL